ncbi:MAG: ABC transporter ATP-binding protein, partial [Phototrophicales bacterium]
IGKRARTFSDVRANVTGAIVDILTNASAVRNFANTCYEKKIHERVSEKEQKADKKRILTLVQIENYRRLSLVLLGSGMFIALLLGWQAQMVTIGQMTTIMGQTMMMVGAAWMMGWGI